MVSSANITVLLASSYLLGSVPTGLIVSKWRGVDIRKQGSGNFGATNVGRVVGRKWGVLVLVLDAAKGAVSTIAAGLVTGHFAEAPVDGLTRNLIWLGAGLACLLGNVFPVFAGFRGGKGVATSLGVLLGIYPYLTLPALSAFVVWAFVVKFGGYVSLGSLAASAYLPIAFLTMAWLAAWPLSDHYPLLCLLVLICVLVFVRHRTNIARLLAGTENRIGESKPG